MCIVRLCLCVCVYVYMLESSNKNSNNVLVQEVTEIWGGHLEKFKKNFLQKLNSYGEPWNLRGPWPPGPSFSPAYAIM